MASDQLKAVSPELITPNPENPRLIFRQEEMESLMRSIDRYGIQVPLTVYRSGAEYILIDGERRWRCANKLNLKTVPVIIQKEPTELQNLVLMYNIHALREQWDYYTIASKLTRVIELFERENGYKPNEINLSELTGLTRGAIRRCQMLIDLPEQYKEILRVELEKPKLQQRLSEDFFIEMEKSLKAVVRRIPEYEPRLDDIRDTLVEKYREKLIPAVTDFRSLSKIATAIDSLGIAQRTAKKSLDKVFDRGKKYSIRDAYVSTVEFSYDEKKAARYIDSLTRFVNEIVKDEKESELDDELIMAMGELVALMDKLLSAKR